MVLTTWQSHLDTLLNKNISLFIFLFQRHVIMILALVNHCILDPELDCRNCIIKGIQLISINEAANNLGWGEIKDNLPVSTLIKGILYISNTQREVIATLPFHNLIKFVNNGKLNMTYFTQQIWQNCYVEFADIVGITQVNGLQFNIFYDEI